MKLPFKRLLIATVAVIALAFPIAASAAPQYYPCDSSHFRTDTIKVILYENSDTDHSDGDDYLLDCANSEGDLGSIAHAPAGGCNAPLHLADNWSKCVSSVRPYMPSGYIFCLYSEKNFGGLDAFAFGSGWTGRRANLGEDGQNDFFFSDALISYRFKTGASSSDC